MLHWDVEIGKTMYYSLPAHNTETRPGDELTLMVRDRCVEVFLTEGNRYLGEVYDDELRDKVKTFDEEDRLYLAEVTRIVPDDGTLQVRVMFPAASVKSNEVYTFLLLPNTVYRVQQIMERRNIQVEISEFLRGEMLLRGKYLCLSRKAGKNANIITPRYRFPLQQGDEIDHTTLTRVFNLENSDFFKTCMLVRCDVRFIQAEAEASDGSRGLRELLRPSFMTAYFKLWQEYMDEEKLILKEMASRLQPLRYKNVREHGNEWVFELAAEVPPEWLEELEEYGQIPIAVKPEGSRASDGEVFTDQEIRIGNVTRLFSNQLRTTVQKNAYIPREGDIALSLRGDLSIQLRRGKALERMQQGLAEINCLEQILSRIQPGQAVMSDRAAMSAATPTLLDGNPPLEKQREAIKKAINTPDLCLIQGPPGTGKTSVIRTLVKRIKEEKPNARILLTAYQHTAVDNAIAGLYKSGVVSYRLDASREENPDSYEDILTWTKTVADECWAGMIKRGEDDRLQSLDRLEKELQEIKPEGGMTTRERLEQVLNDYRGILPQDFIGTMERHLEEMREIGMVIERSVEETAAGKDAGDELKKLLENCPPDTAVLIKEKITPLELVKEATERLAGMGIIQAKDAEEIRRGFSEIRRQLPGAKHSRNNRVIQARFAAEYKAFIETVRRAANRTAEKEGPKEGLKDQPDFLSRWKVKVFNYIDEQRKSGPSGRAMVLNQWVERLRNNYGVDKMFRRYAGVLGGTCMQSGAARFELEDTPFDYVIIDEAARANPLDLLVPMVMGRRIIMVGDHRQLPHIIEHKLKGRLEERLEKQEMIAELEDSIFARLWEYLPEEKRCFLDTQCRMHPILGRMVSGLFYDIPIKPAEGTELLLNDTQLYPGKPLVWVHIEGDRDDGQFTNEQEARAIVDHLVKLREAGTDYSIGVISFYRRQVDLIKRKMAEKGMAGENIKVDTVDAFQGRQRDIILLSTVRSRGQSLGFTAMPSRQNVALSRARRLLVVFGDAEHLSRKNLTFEQLYKLCKEVEHETAAV